MRQVKPILPVLQQAHPLARGLVGAWLFFERGGTTLYDLSGNNNKGTLTLFPAAPWKIDLHGAALTFDGTDDYVDVGNSFNFSNNFTIEAWLKRNATAQYNTIFSNWNNAPDSGYIFQIQNDVGQVNKLGFYSASAWSYSSGTIADTTSWHHAAMTHTSGNVLTFYIDGAVSGTASRGAIGSSSISARIGRQGFTTNYFN